MLQFCCKFTSVSVAKNYQNRSITQLHKVIAKNKRVQFFSPQSSIFTILVKDYHLIIFLQIVTKHSKNKSQITIYSSIMSLQHTEQKLYLAALCQTWLVPGWVTVCGQVNHLGM